MTLAAPACHSQVLEDSGQGWKLLHDTIASYKSMANKPSTDDAKLQVSTHPYSHPLLISPHHAPQPIYLLY